MTYVFNPRQTTQQACDKYTELFGKEENMEEISQEIQNIDFSEEDKNRFFDCLKKCVSFSEALKIIGKCATSGNIKECVIKELKQAAKTCFINCLN